jgi:dipeptidyl aminopeptidase/acylaminoacyl peptidase
MLRKTDGSPALRLGEGSLRAFSRDKRWILSVIQSPAAQLMLYPTGAGQARRVDRGELESYSAAAFHPDGKRIVVCGNERGHASRCYVRPLGQGPLRALTPEGYDRGEISPDGATFAAGTTDGYRLFPVDGGAPRVIAGLGRTDRVVRWSPNGNALWIALEDEMSKGLVSQDVTTGRRSPLPPITPVRRPGLLQSRELTLADDPRGYAYLTYEQKSHVFIVQGMH